MVPAPRKRLVGRMSPVTGCCGLTGGISQDRRTQPERNSNVKLLQPISSSIALCRRAATSFESAEVVVDIWHGTYCRKRGKREKRERGNKKIGIKQKEKK